jgi:hypothetical protein
MKGVGARWAALVSVMWVVVSYGCGRSTVPLDMTTLDPSQNQWRIAAAYSQEAAVMRRKADELAYQAAHYEQLFGPDSEWTTSTRLLAQFYEEAARERERLAELHVTLSHGHLHARPVLEGPPAPEKDK